MSERHEFEALFQHSNKSVCRIASLYAAAAPKHEETRANTERKRTAKTIPDINALLLESLRHVNVVAITRQPFSNLRTG